MLPQCQWSGIAFNNKTLPQKFTTPQIHRQNLTAIQPRSFNLVSLPNPPIIEVQVGWANWPGQSLNNFNETFTRSSLALNMNRKLPLNQKFAIHGKIMAKKQPFFMEFWPILDIFHRSRSYLCSKWGVLGFHKQVTHRRRGDEPFLNLGSAVHDWPKKGPFWTKNGQTWQACQRSKVAQKGPKWSI